MNSIENILLLVFLGGVFPLILHKNFNLMRVSAVVLMGIGTFCGFVYSLLFLLSEKSSLTYNFSLLPHFPIMFEVNQLASFFIMIICFIGLMGVIYGSSYLNDRNKSLRTAFSFFFYSMLIISMILVVLADNLITFAFVWEIMSLSSFLLIMYDYEEQEVRKAGFIYFIFTHVGAMAIFAAFGLIYSCTKSWGFEGIEDISEGLKLVIFTLTFIGFGSKAGIFPIHFWLPHAHPAAPSHVSAMMSGVMIKIGIYGIIKTYLLLNTNSPFIAYVMITFGAISGIAGVVYALGQHNLKKLLAYSSIENIGIITLGLGLGMLGVSTDNLTMTYLGFAGGILHILNHALFKSTMFLGAGAILHQTKIGDIEQMGGLMKNMKITGITFLIGALAISGLPPFNGFVSEFLIYYGSFKGINDLSDSCIFSILTILSLALIGGLAAACFTKVIGIVFLGNPRSKEAQNAVECKSSMQIPMIILSLLCIVIGVMPSMFTAIVNGVIKTFDVLPDDFIAPTTIIASNISLGAFLFFSILAVVILAWRLFYANNKNTKTVTWGCGYIEGTSKMQYSGSSYADQTISFFKPFVKIKKESVDVHGLFPKKSKFHSNTIDIAEHILSIYFFKPLVYIMKKLRWIQSGDIHIYIAYIFAALFILLIIAGNIK